MHITISPMTDSDIDDAVGFVQSANPFLEHTWGWETGRFIDWRWGGNTLRDAAEPGFFGRHGAIVRRDDAIAALVISEVGRDDHCILTSNVDPDLVAAALDWLLKERTGEKLTLYPSDDATWVHEVLAERGLEKGEVAELGWHYDVTKVGGAPGPPDGFVIDRVSGEADYAELDRCLKGAFGGEGDRAAMMRSLATNPQYRPELNVIARSADGRIASYCRGTVDPRSGVGSIDPVATHPDFQGRGLGKTIVLTCFAAQASLGGKEVYIGSGPPGSAGSHLYRKLDPVETRSYSEWSQPSP
ncbi:MAG: GNAT family N-acetyltransferase [Acidimicrobiia bacterium]|nr:GNAT family N-acetyltransferase [Acidimicrobiia bacterium]